MTIKPAPVIPVVVCSLCGEPWEAHKLTAEHEPSPLDCIRLLRAKVAPVRPNAVHRLARGMDLPAEYVVLPPWSTTMDGPTEYRTPPEPVD